MRDEDRLRAKADSLIKDLKTVDCLLLYKKLKKEVEDNPRLCRIDRQRKKVQAGLKFLPPEKKKEAYLAAKKLQEEYDSDPLLINLKAQEKEVKDRIAILTEEKF